MSTTSTSGRKSVLSRREHAGPGSGRDEVPSLLRPPPPSRPLHVCFVAPLAWPVFSRDPHIDVIGGAEVQQSILARALARAGYRVSMICLDFGQPQRVVLDGVMVYKAYRRDAGLPVLRFIHPGITTMWRMLAAVDADVYYQRCAAAATAVVAQFCRYRGRRSIYAGASDVDFLPGQQQIRYRRDRWLFERGLARVDRIVVQNEQQQRNCRANYGREATLIPSCYEPPANARPGAGDCVLWVGNIIHYKRPELLLELARRLPRRRFVMIGGAGDDGFRDKSYFNGIRRGAAALPNVEFTGFLPLARVESYFDRARVLVNTSDYEGMPNTFLQAWARGVPAVAFVDTGARLRGEAVYRAVETTEEAAAEIERLFADENYRACASARCREYFGRTHSVAGVLARYEQLLTGLVHEPGRGR